MSGLNLVLARDVLKNLAKIRGLDSTNSDAYYTDVIFSNDGTKMFAAVNDRHTKNGKIHEYKCRNFDSNTAEYVRKIDLNTANFTPAAGSSTAQSITKIGFNNDGSKLFAIGLYRVTRDSGAGGKGWSTDVKYVESYLHELTLTSVFSLAAISSEEVRGLYGNRWKTASNTDPAEGPTLLGFVDVNTANENTYRVPTGFEFQEDGKKLFITSVRGHVAAAESEVDKDFTYFGDVCVLTLAAAYDIREDSPAAGNLPNQSGYTGFTSANNMIVRKNVLTPAKDAGVAPLDIVLHNSGKTMSILCMDTARFTGLIYHYTLETANNISTAKFDIFSSIKATLTLPTSLHINNFSTSGKRKNLVVVGVTKGFVQPRIDINRGVVARGGKSGIADANPFSIFQFSKVSSKAKPNNYYKYDPTQSKVVVKGGIEVPISSLIANQSKFEAAGVDVTFIGLVSKEVYGETYYAIVVNPSAVIPLDVTLVGGNAYDKIQTQPFLGDNQIQGLLAQQNNQPFNDIIA